MIRIEITAEYNPSKSPDTERDQISRSLFALGFVPTNTAVSAANASIAGVSGTDTAEKPLTAAQKKAAERAAKEAAEKAQQNISSGGERVDPKDTPADEKQDAKDEAADTAAQQPKPMVLTHDSVRSLLGGYVQAFGMAAAQKDGPKLIGIAKISEIPNDQKELAKAVIAIATGIEKNPHKRTLEGDGIEAEKMAEMKPIVQHSQKVIAG